MRFVENKRQILGATILAAAGLARDTSILSAVTLAPFERPTRRWPCSFVPPQLETKTGEANKKEGQADDGKEELGPALKSEDLRLKFELVQGKDLGGDARALATPRRKRPREGHRRGKLGYVAHAFLDRITSPVSAT